MTMPKFNTQMHKFLHTQNLGRPIGISWHRSGDIVEVNNTGISKRKCFATRIQSHLFRHKHVHGPISISSIDQEYHKSAVQRNGFKKRFVFHSRRPARVMQRRPGVATPYFAWIEETFVEISPPVWHWHGCTLLLCMGFRTLHPHYYFLPWFVL